MLIAMKHALFSLPLLLALSDIFPFFSLYPRIHLFASVFATAYLHAFVSLCGSTQTAQWDTSRMDLKGLYRYQSVCPGSWKSNLEFDACKALKNVFSFLIILFRWELRIITVGLKLKRGRNRSRCLSVPLIWGLNSVCVQSIYGFFFGFRTTSPGVRQTDPVLFPSFPSWMLYFSFLLLS